MGESQTIYLDANATAPPRHEAFEAMRPWLTERAGNPASAHAAGRQARRALEDAREQIAALLGAFPDEVVFTSGATEANNLAIFGLCGDPPAHLLASSVEHPCVIEPLKHLAEHGFEVDWLPVTGEGIVDPQALAARIRPETRLIAVMLANHETGAVQPVQALTTEYSVLFHCDAAQAVAKMPVNFHDLGVTTLSVSGHKFGASAGIGVLLVNRCTRLQPMLFGGHQQRGRRPGTEPVALAVGFAAALDASLRDLDATNSRMLGFRRRFLEALQRDAAPVVVNGPAEGGLPHVLNLSFPGCRADALLMALDLAGVMCSTGSACSSGSLLPSPVLSAMKIGDERLHSAMRFSFAWNAREEQIGEAARRILRVVKRLRETADLT
jgi:cysteine desulfurase